MQVKITTRKRTRVSKRTSVELSHNKVKKLFEAADITPIPGMAYAIYECGHVLSSEEDPQINRYYSDVGISVRSCPKCQDKRLVSKYKICKCGAEHYGKRVISSQFCGECPKERKAAAREAAKPDTRHLRNGHMADLNKGFCIHKSKCLLEYQDYEAVPCRDCGKFELPPSKSGVYEKSSLFR